MYKNYEESVNKEWNAKTIISKINATSYGHATLRETLTPCGEWKYTIVCAINGEDIYDRKENTNKIQTIIRKYKEI